jgi:hypothetical protein
MFEMEGDLSGTISLLEKVVVLGEFERQLRMDTWDRHGCQPFIEI